MIDLLKKLNLRFIKCRVCGKFYLSKFYQRSDWFICKKCVEKSNEQ